MPHRLPRAMPRPLVHLQLPPPAAGSGWTRLSGTTNAPTAAEEAEALELGRQVAMHRGYQSVLFDDPADDA